MQYTTLGKTGLKVSRLGFGCMRLPMKEGRIVRELAIPMLHRAKELGVNYFDTAVGYCNQDSQRCLGEALEGMRDQVIVSTKNGHYNKKDERGWWKNLEDSLERLRTDYIDIYNFHGLRWQAYADHVQGPGGQLEWMLRAKEQGMIRHICCSFHDTAENLKKLASTGHFDSVTLQYNILDQSNESAFEHVVKKCGMGITVMGPVGGGRLGGESDEIRKMLKGAKSVPEVALRFVLSNPYVSIALSGMDAMEQVAENIKVASRRTPMSTVEHRRVKSILTRFRKLSELYCTGCNYCMPCPTGVNISGSFMALNQDRVYGLKAHAKRTYDWLRGGQAIHCMACGKCEPKCPQNIEIIKQLRETVRTFDDAYGHVVARLKPMGLKSFKASRGKWSATLNAKLEVRNLSDQPVEVAARFGAGAEVKPKEGTVKLDAFGIASQKLVIECASNGGANVVDTAAAVEGGEKVELSGAAFSVVFAPPARKSGAKVPRSAIPVELCSKEQLATGTSRVLANHGATCRFAYDDDALFLSARVKDDLATGRGGRQGDRLELCIDARPPARFGRNGSDPKVFRIDFSAPGGGDSVRISKPRGVDATGIACRTRVTADGYSITAAIPWSLLGLSKTARRHVGLDVCLQSHDRRGKQNVEMYWTGGESNGRPDRFGHLFLTV
ncbi:MAG: aldo/keto reductase [Candidatus Hydrogenedentes bacterium]|nr:aldo/keto reductase [Candidatus Hydrogenedentota bacterium]